MDLEGELVIVALQNRVQIRRAFGGEKKNLEVLFEFLAQTFCLKNKVLRLVRLQRRAWHYLRLLFFMAGNQNEETYRGAMILSTTPASE